MVQRFLVVVGILFGSFVVYAEDSEPVPVVYGNRSIDQLSKSLQNLEKYVYRRLGKDGLDHPISSSPTDKKLEAQLASLYSKVDDATHQIPSLIGRMEKAEHTAQKLLENNQTFIQYLTQFKKTLAEREETIKALQEKIQKLEAQAAGAASEAEKPAEKKTEPKDPTAIEDIPSLPPLDIPESKLPTEDKDQEVETTPDPELSIEDLEKKARSYLVTTQYADAQKTLEDLLKRNITADQSSSAYFYLGEVAYLKKDYAAAADAYLKSFQKSPRCPKAPKSLLKLSMTLNALNKKEAACSSLKKLLSEYPKADSAILSMANAKKIEYQCQG